MRDAHPLPGADVVVAGVDGAPLRLHLVSHGRAGGPPLLLLHGVPTSSYLWRDVVRDLEHELGCLVPDLVGAGGSERPATRRPYGLDAQARALLRLLDAHGVERFTVAGHGLGGSVAVHLAAFAPERVGGLVLLAAPVHADVWPVPPALPLLVPGLGELVAGLPRWAPALARRALVRALGAGPSEREIDCYLRPLHAPEGAAGLLALVRSADLRAVEASWRIVRADPPPALVLWGGRDQVLSTAYGRRVAGELAGAAWVPVGEAGHLLPQERPERVAEEIAAFVTDLPVASRVGGPRP